MTDSPRLPRNLVLHTKRLVLRPFVDSDFSSCARIVMNIEVKKTYILPDFADVAETKTLFQKFLALSADPYRYVYAIDCDDALIGFVNDVEISEDAIEVGYVIHPDWQNQGFATEALQALMDELFRVGFAIVKAGFFQENAASRRVMEKAGMHKIPYEDDLDYRGSTHHCLYFAAEGPDPR